jgi:hypothetical protein
MAALENASSYDSNIFLISNDGILCKPCSYVYSQSKIRTRYVNIPASPRDNFNITKHIKTISHRSAFATYSKKLKLSLPKEENILHPKEESKNIEKSSNELFGSKIKMQSEIILTLIPVIIEKMKICLWIIQQNVPNNHYFSLQQLIDSVSNNSPLKCFTHNSSYSFHELCGSIYDAYKGFVKKSISSFKLFSLLVDDSTNVCRVKQLCVYVRYVDSNINVITLFLGLREIGSEGATSQKLFLLICDVLKEYDLEMKNMVSFCSDGASNMRGLHNGLLALFRAQIPDLIDYYCSSHRFNLVIQKFLQMTPNINNPINDIVDISTHINLSPNRISLLHDIQHQFNKPSYQIHQRILTRWSSTFTCLRSITKQLFVLLTLIYEDNKSSPCETLSNFLKKVQNDEYICNVAAADVVLEKMNITILKLQTKNIDIGTVEDSILHLTEWISSSELNSEHQKKARLLTEDRNEFFKKKNISCKIQETDSSQSDKIIDDIKKTVLENISDRFKINKTLSF